MYIVYWWKIIQYSNSIKVRICITDESCLTVRCPRSHVRATIILLMLGCTGHTFLLRSGSLNMHEISQSQSPKGELNWGFWSCRHSLPNQPQWQSTSEIIWWTGTNHWSHCYQWLKKKKSWVLLQTISKFHTPVTTKKHY